MIAVKVVNSTGWGPVSSTIAGIAYAVQQKRLFQRPTVLNLSLARIDSRLFVQAIDVAVKEGIIVVVAAGNDGDVACSGSFVGETQSAIVVGAATVRDGIANFSNYGWCVDMFA